MAILLLFGTFFLTVALDGMKSSYYFTQPIRNILSDFSSTISIVVWTLISRLLLVCGPGTGIGRWHCRDPFGMATQNPPPPHTTHTHQPAPPPPDPRGGSRFEDGIVG